MIFLIFFKDDEDLDNGWKGSAGSWEDPPSAPSYIWSLSAPSYALSLTHGVCPSSCISSTYMNMASHNLVACARHNVPSWSEAMYMVEASNKEEDSTHC